MLSSFHPHIRHCHAVHCVATCANAALTAGHTWLYQSWSMIIILWPDSFLYSFSKKKHIAYCDHICLQYISIIGFNASNVCVFQSRFLHVAPSPLLASLISFAQRIGCNHDVFNATVNHEGNAQSCWNCAEMSMTTKMGQHKTVQPLDLWGARRCC